jgi:hypothetical protein
MSAPSHSFGDNGVIRKVAEFVALLAGVIILAGALNFGAARMNYEPPWVPESPSYVAPELPTKCQLWLSA